VLRTLPPQRSARADTLILGLIVAVAAAVYSAYALRVASFQQDESLYLHQARYVAAHFPSALWHNAFFVRGIQRLDPLLLAGPFAFMRGPGAFEVDRVIQCLLFASAAVPVFLLARSAGLRRRAAYLAAMLAIVMPWAVVSGSFLSESAAYPAFAWSLYGVWLSATQPSLRHDLLALLAIALAILSRTAMLALAPLLPLAVLWQEWDRERSRASPLARLRALPAALWGRHRLLTVLATAAITLYLAERVGILPSSVGTLTGEYGVPHVGSLQTLLERYRYYLSRVAVGTGFLALAVGLPWVLRTLWRPRDERRHALAVVCALGIGCMLLSLLSAGADERYLFYAAAPVALMFAAGLGERAGIGVLLGALAVVLLLDSVSWPALANLYDFFTYPAAIFYQRVLLLHLGRLHVPLVHLSATRLIEAAILLVTLVWWLAARRARAARPAATLLGIGVLACCSVQTGYALQKYVNGPGSGHGASARSWVDEHVPDGTRVGALAVSLGESSFYAPVWEETQYWNTSVELGVFFEAPGAMPFPLGVQPVHMTIEPDSGRLSAFAGPATATPASPPEYMVVPLQGTNRIVLAGTVLAHSAYLPLELMRLSRPARALWSLSGTSVEGFLTSGAATSATVFSGALAGISQPCATFSLIAPPGYTGRWPYTVSSGRVVQRGTLRALTTTAVSVPLSPRATPRGPSATLAVTVNGQASFAGILASAKLAFFNVAECARRRA
jgi:hypothetical protein